MEFIAYEEQPRLSKNIQKYEEYIQIHVIPQLEKITKLIFKLIFEFVPITWNIEILYKYLLKIQQQQILLSFKQQELDECPPLIDE